MTDQRKALRDEFEKWAGTTGGSAEASEQLAWKAWQVAYRAGAEAMRDHLTFVLAHGGFDRESIGGCSCETCADLRKCVANVQKREGEQYYAERYGKG